MKKMMKPYPSFDKYQADQPRHQISIIRALRRLVKKVAPRLQESVKWGNGFWIKGTMPISYVFTAKDYVQFGFTGGYRLKDPKKLLHGEGRYVRHIKVHSVREIDARAFAALIRQAIR